MGEGGICEKIPGTGIFFQTKKNPVPGTFIKKKNPGAWGEWPQWGGVRCKGLGDTLTW